MIRILIFFPVFLISLSTFSQSAVARLHFESAEKAYNAGNYQEVLAKLDETEKLTGPTSKTLYLRVAAQDKLLQKSGVYTDAKSFELLTDLRGNASTYLEVMADHGLDDRYREVYAVNERLAQYPKTASDWRETRDKLEADRKEEQAMAIRREEERRIAMELESLRAEQKSVYDSKMFEAAEILDVDSVGAVTVYIIRPKDDASSTTQVLFVNEEVYVPKLDQGEHVVLYCTSGLLRIGVLDDQEFVKKRRRKRNLGLLAGGVGFATTSIVYGKVASRNADPLLLNLDGTRKVYYFRTAVDSKSRGGGINYWEIPETEATLLLESSKQLKE